MDRVLSEILDKTRQYFEQKDEVIMVFLFGSYVSGKYCSESDIDIAIFIKDEDNEIERDIQNNIEWLLRKIEWLLRKNVEIVNLSRARATLAWNILRKGIPLVIKDRKLYIDFLLEVSNEAEDFVYFNLDTWRRKYDIRKS